MKKYSSIVTGILLIAVLSFTSTACSRKVGCYFSQTPELKTCPYTKCTVDNPYTKT